MSLLKLEIAKRKTAQRKQQQITADTIRNNIKILNKNNELVPFIPNRAQAHLMQNLTGRDIILKARQLGFSTLIRALHESKAMTKRSTLATLAHDNPTTQNLRRMSKRMWQYLPTDIRPERGIDNADTTIYSNTESEVVIRTAGSKEAGRSFMLSDVHGSEVAFWKNARDNMAGIMQAVPMNGNIILESTPNGANGWFYETCMDALDGNSVWTLHFYEWWWNDDYALPLSNSEELDYTDDEQALVNAHGLTPEQIKWRRYKIKEIPHTFTQEYPEDVYSCFISSGNSFFGDISNVFTADSNVSPIDTHRYVAGLDVGIEVDYTVMVVIDTYDNSMVDMLRINRIDSISIKNRIAQMARKWNNCKVLMEINAYPLMLRDLRESKVNVIPFKTTAKSKPSLIQSLYTGLHEQGLTLQDDADLKHELRNFISIQNPTTNNWRYEAASGSHDDCVIALALAWWIATRGNVTIERI